LIQTHPNPLSANADPLDESSTFGGNPTTIDFALPNSAFVTLRVYDVLGRQVCELLNEKLGPGNYRTRWDARGFPSGVYFYRLTAGDFVQTKKLILLR
jgi:hypothetical protein